MGAPFQVWKRLHPFFLGPTVSRKCCKHLSLVRESTEVQAGTVWFETLAGNQDVSPINMNCFDRYTEKEVVIFI